MPHVPHLDVQRAASGMARGATGMAGAPRRTREVRGSGARSQQPRPRTTQVWLGLWKLFTTASAQPSGAQSILPPAAPPANQCAPQVWTSGWLPAPTALPRCCHLCGRRPGQLLETQLRQHTASFISPTIPPQSFISPTIPPQSFMRISLSTQRCTRVGRGPLVLHIRAGCAVPPRQLAIEGADGSTATAQPQMGLDVAPAGISTHVRVIAALDDLCCDERYPCRTARQQVQQR